MYKLLIFGEDLGVIIELQRSLCKIRDGIKAMKLIQFIILFKMEENNISKPITSR